MEIVFAHLIGEYVFRTFRTCGKYIGFKEYAKSVIFYMIPLLMVGCDLLPVLLASIFGAIYRYFDLPVLILTNGFRLGNLGFAAVQIGSLILLDVIMITIIYGGMAL